MRISTIMIGSFKDKRKGGDDIVFAEVDGAERRLCLCLDFVKVFPVTL